jgi:flagellar protein FliO/FliZ
MFSLNLQAVVLSILSQLTPEAGGEDQEFMKDWPFGPSQDPVVFKVVAALVVVIGLILVTIYILKRYFKIGGAGTARGRVRVIDSLPLGGKKMIHVLKVYERSLVIGVTGDRIDLLTELSDEEVPAGSARVEGRKKGFGEIFPLLPRRRKGEKAGVKGIED